MDYIFKQKLQLADLAGLQSRPKRILIYEPESDLAALYAYYLREHNFEIKHCFNTDAIRQHVVSFQPHLLIFSADGPELSLKIKPIAATLIKEFPGLNLVSTGYSVSGRRIGELMSIGVISHINRRLSRPQDVVDVVKMVLYN